MVVGSEKPAHGPVMHQQRPLPFWQKTVILLCLGSILLFSLNLMMDAESTSQWSGGLSALSSKLESLPMPVIPEDEPTCLSRAQQNLYRREDKRLPMPTALGVTWKRYGELHRFCSFQKNKNWTDVFVNQEDSGCNYLIYLEGGAGLGNRILSLTSAFLYALATDRILLIDSRRGKTLGKLLCEPFANSSWLLPEDFPYQEVEQATALGKAKELDWNVSVVNLHLEHLQSGGDQEFFCDDTHFYLRKVQWLAWTSTQYYVTKLFMIPSFWRRLTPLFNSDPDAFTHLSRLLILPNNDLWAHIVRVYWGYLSSTGLRLGLQIRLHGRGDLAAFDLSVKDRIMDCLTSHRILPKMLDRENVSQLSALYSRKFRAMRRNQPPVDAVVFIASLQNKYQEEMMKMFDRQANVDNSIIRVHMVSHSGRQDNSEEQSHNALVEMWLLSFSDVIATSAYSTFGYIAQGIGGLTPYIMNIRGENITGDGKASCEVGQSSQPCTHFPMKPACESLNITAAHRAWMDAHVKKCQDQPGGLQLGTYPVPVDA